MGNVSLAEIQDGGDGACYFHPKNPSKILALNPAAHRAAYWTAFPMKHALGAEGIGTDAYTFLAHAHKHAHPVNQEQGCSFCLVTHLAQL